MAGSAAAKGTAAAEAVEAFLRGRPRLVADAVATDMAGMTGAQPPTSERPGLPVISEGAVHGRSSSASRPVSDLVAPQPMYLAQPDWLHHRLTVSGSCETLAAFQEVACGAGVIPWQLDLASLKEDWLHRLVDPAHRTLSLQGARILAAQLREAVERRHTLAVSRVGHSRACPFDLHALMPVPPAILALGPDHPDALLWLWQHWGTTRGLRRVETDTADAHKSVQAPSVGWHLHFWSADWTPWRAVAQIRANWPELRFDVRLSYG